MDQMVQYLAYFPQLDFKYFSYLKKKCVYDILTLYLPKPLNIVISVLPIIFNSII